MWNRISSFIIKNRVVLLIVTTLLTVFFGYKAKNLEMSYDYIKVIPENDPEYVYFQKFKKRFGEDANIFVIGLKDPSVFELQKFNQLYELCQKIKKTEGVSDVISLPTLRTILKDTLNRKFVQDSVFKRPCKTQAELDSLLIEALQVKIYSGLLYKIAGKGGDVLDKNSTEALLLAVAIDGKYLNSSNRQVMMNTILDYCKAFSSSTSIDLHYAGIPYIRAIMVKEMRTELIMLLGLSVLLTSAELFLFFRSWFSVLFTFLVILITIFWCMGTLVLLDYKITLLTGILPALIIVISIPNCVYMYNKYHQEYKRHSNKIKAVSRVIEKIGFLTFMTNANTAVGFFTLYFTDIITIKEFGISAGILSLATFVISLVIIPIFLLFLPPPSEKQLKHLDLGFLRKVNTVLENVTVNHRPWVYAITFILLVISIYGITKLRPISYMVDDLPEDSDVKRDLAFFEQNFSGVMPLEIIIDFKKRKAILRKLNELEQLNDYLSSLNNVSPPLSIISMIKSCNQAYNNGDPSFYALPSNPKEKEDIPEYLANSLKADSLAKRSKAKDKVQQSLLNALVDSSNLSVVRFSCKVADIGTIKMDELVNQSIRDQIKKIFKKDYSRDSLKRAEYLVKYNVPMPDDSAVFDVKITGTTLLFLKGNEYLVNDLSESLVYAFLLISGMMAFIFYKRIKRGKKMRQYTIYLPDPKMIVISMIPNVVPMIITAGIMGLFNIPLKPSTALIFGISFGISIDSTIHYLSKYKQELAFFKGDVLKAVTKSIEEAGVSMIYTSIVLLSGFIIFTVSNFGGTVALGMLTSLTLFFAMFTNLMLLPSLLLTFSKGDHKKRIRIPFATKKHQHEMEQEALRELREKRRG